MAVAEPIGMGRMAGVSHFRSGGRARRSATRENPATGRAIRVSVARRRLGVRHDRRGRDRGSARSPSQIRGSRPEGLQGFSRLMRYLGSKRRIAKHILPIILANRKPEQTYVEPFMGGCNTLEHVANPRIGADSNFYLVELFSAVCRGWVPPDAVSESDHRLAKYDASAFPPHVRAFIRFGCSFGGDWSAGYARNAYDSPTRSTCLESKRSLLRQAQKLSGTEFRHAMYWELQIPPNSVVYCDPPYAETTTYKANTDRFDHAKFWRWCDQLVDSGHSVFVSEYKAPSHWHEVWSGNLLKTCTNPTKRVYAIEKLWTRGRI